MSEAAGSGPSQLESLPCQRCGKETQHSYFGAVNHPLHVFLYLCSCGLWAFPWFHLTRRDRAAVRCVVCRTAYDPTGSADGRLPRPIATAQEKADERGRRRALVAIGTLAFVGLCLWVSLLVLRIIIQRGAASRAQLAAAQAQRPVAAPSPSPTPNAAAMGETKPRQVDVGLGASHADFIAAHGFPVRSSDELGSYSSCGTRTAVTEWTVMYSQDKAIAITKNACPPGAHDRATADEEASSLFPPDAVKGKTFRTSDGWLAQSYRSATLAKRLPRSAFHGCKGTPVPAGTFFYLLSPEQQFWMIAAGQCP